MRKITDKLLVNISYLTCSIIKEHHKQIDKFGKQTATPAEWLMYLGEEFGELCEAVCSVEDGDNGKGITEKNIYNEAIQVATLALKIAEMYMEG